MFAIASRVIHEYEHEPDRESRARAGVWWWDEHDEHGHGWRRTNGYSCNDAGHGWGHGKCECQLSSGADAATAAKSAARAVGGQTVSYVYCCAVACLALYHLAFLAFTHGSDR